MPDTHSATPFSEDRPLQLPDFRVCPFRDIREKLSRAGLRPTRQRLGLGWLLFARGPRHVTADELRDEARRSRLHVSTATVYNTLNQFTEAGLLRQVAIGGGRSVFDTETRDHAHMVLDGDTMLQDLPSDFDPGVSVAGIPEGYEIERVDVVVVLRRAAP